MTNALPCRTRKKTRKMARSPDKKAPPSDHGGPDNEDFFQATTLHGLKYIKKSGGTRLIWIVVLLLSLLMTYLLMKSTVMDFFTSPTEITLNSTNTPIGIDDFPIITMCNINMISRNKLKEQNKTSLYMSTVAEAGNFSQPCSQMIIWCQFFGIQCRSFIQTVATDVGWCCQVDVTKLNKEQLDQTELIIGTAQGLQMFLNVQSFDYALASWYSDGVLVSICLPKTSVSRQD